MSKYPCFPALLLMLCPLCITAQVPDQDMEYELESIAQGEEEEQTDLLQIAEDIEELKQQQIAVNFAGEDELSRIPHLNIFQVNNLLQYRYRTGFLYSPYELIIIKGFDKETIENILPYLSFRTEQKKPEIKIRNITRYSRHKIMLRSSFDLQKRKGYLSETENGFLGDPSSHYFRYKASYSNILSAALTVQQDAGEPFGKEYHPYGVDFISGYIALKNYGNLKSLIIGNYHAEYGQGLALWSGLAFGKSANAVDIKRYARGVKSFSGGEENRAMQGVAVAYEFGDNLEVSAFYSNRSVDATISEFDSTGAPAFVSSLPATGLHRTANELAKKDMNRIRAIGGNTNFRSRGFSIGLTAVDYQLAIPLEESSDLYKKFQFHGSSLSNFSLDFNYLYKDINLFGEWAISDNGSSAGNIGFQCNPSDQLYLTLLYRHLQKDYQFLYNAPFAESGDYGERGTFFGLQWNISGAFKFNAYLDSYRFDWMRFRLNAPSRGRDILTQLQMKFSRNFTSYIRFKNDVQQVNKENSDLPQLTESGKTTLRYHTSYHIYPRIRMASRIERTFYNSTNAKESGFMIFQDIRYEFRNIPFQFTTRYAIIDTKSWETRMYAYENDLLYSFSIPAYYGRSNRFYILLNWKFSRSIVLEGKYGITKFFDREEISSGLNLIKGNVQSNISFQLRVKF